MKAIVLMVVAVFSFTVMDAISKYLMTIYPIPFVIWSRYFLSCVVIVLFFGRRYGLELIKTKLPKMQIARGLSLVLSTLFFFNALARMPLANAQSIVLIAPILVTFASVKWLGEPLPRQSWWVLLVSFLGVLLVVKPGTALFSWTMIFPLCAALCFAAYQISTRMVAPIDNNMATLFIGGLVGTVASALFLPGNVVLPHSVFDAILFTTIGAIGAGGHLLMVKAFELAPASRLAPFVYLQIVGALVLGYLVFDTFPDGWALIGMAMIAFTGVVNALIKLPKPLPQAATT